MWLTNEWIKSLFVHVLGIILASKLISATYKCPKSEGRFKYGLGPNCHKYYECVKNIATIKTCSENQGFQYKWRGCVWKGYVAECQMGDQAPVCGKIPEEDQNDKRIENPWIVAVFQRDRSDKDWVYASPGVIIGPKTILTSCRLGRRIDGEWRQSVNASSYQVVAGIESVDPGHFDEFSQTMKVSSVQINPKNKDFHHFCNALMQLENPLKFNATYVQPVCLPNIKPPVRPNVQGTFGYSGFGSLVNYAEKSDGSDGFRHLNSKRVSLASQPYCAASTHSKNWYCGAPGAGKSFGDIRNSCTGQAIALTRDSSNNVWYLLGQGTTHNSYNRNICSIQKLDDDPRLTWIMRSIRCGSKKYPCGNGKCIRLSKVCDSDKDCPNGEDEDPKLCQAMNPCINEATFRCGVYENCIKLEKVCDGIPDCLNARDEDPEFCKNFKSKNPTPFKTDTAPTPGSREGTTAAPTIPTISASVTITTKATTTHEPAKTSTSSPGGSRNKEVTKVTQSHDRVCPILDMSEGVTGKCTLPGGGSSNCTGNLPVGTTAILACKALYKPSSYEAEFIKKCTDELKWKPKRYFECKPDCGRSVNSAPSAYIVHGLSVTSQERFPWHAAIFTVERNQWMYTCGATLIHRSFILTAAHCVTDAYGDNNKSPEAFKVALAPTNSKFDACRQDSKVQMMDIKKIIPHEKYDPTSKYQSDIAILVLKRPVSINPTVIPACLPSSNANELDDGTIGEVPGFGIDETGNVSEELKYARLPIVSSQDCTRSVKFKPAMNTFCAGYTNGTGVCHGDSGGGLVFEINQRYFVYGIVSVGPSGMIRTRRGIYCDQKTYSVFTSVAPYAEWIYRKMNLEEIET